MQISKGLSTWAGLIAAVGQYLGAVAVFLEASDSAVALGPLATATATLIVVIAGRMKQADTALKHATAPATTLTLQPAQADQIASAVSGAIGGKVGLGYSGTANTANVAWTQPRPGAEVTLGQPTDLSREIPAGSEPPKDTA
jgi:hypothetical protein